jgi:hypothetical protein
MDIILLAIAVVALVVAFVMSLAAWRLMRRQEDRSVAALSIRRVSERPLAREAESARRNLPGTVEPPFRPAPVAVATSASLKVPGRLRKPRASVPLAVAAQPAVADRPVRHSPPSSHTRRVSRCRRVERDNGGRQKSLAFTAVILFVVLSGGLVWMMAGPRHDEGAVGPRCRSSSYRSRTRDEQQARGAGPGPQSRVRQADRTSIGGGVPVRSDGHIRDQLTRERGFLKLNAGDESPFVSLDARPVARYRRFRRMTASYRTSIAAAPRRAVTANRPERPAK